MRTLARHFFSRFFDNDLVSPGGDIQTTVVQVLALLATPSLLSAFYLLPGFWSLDRYFFVCYSMVVAGFVMVVEWDMLFPDRRDYSILMPLPMTAGRLFFTKVAALSIFVGVFILDSNLFGILLVPPVTARSPGPGVLEILVAHSAAVLGGGLFMALSFAGLQGILINTLTARAFRRMSPLIQMAAMAALVLVFFARPLVLVTLPSLLRANSPLLYWFPPIWFFGLYESLAPTGQWLPAYYELALTALRALGIAALVFLLTYLIGYRRHCRRVLESVETGFSGPGLLIRGTSALLNKFLLTRPVERAAFYFTAKTLTRSSRHRLFLAGYSAAGLALALLDTVKVLPQPGGTLSVRISDLGLVALPLTLGFFLVSGLRAAFNFPVELNANWIFQATESEERAQHLAGARKWVLLCGVIPLSLLVAPVVFSRWSWDLALSHLFFAVTMSLVLVELLFANFRKVPFTCSYFPGKVNLTVLLAFYLFGYTTYAYTLSSVEAAIVLRPVAMIVFYSLAFAAIWLLARRRERDLNRGFVLDWEDAPDPLVRQLHLDPLGRR